MMEHNRFTTDVATLSQSLLRLRENLTYTEFDTLMFSIQDANNKGKLEDFLSQATFLCMQGSEPATAFQDAHFLIVQEQGEEL